MTITTNDTRDEYTATAGQTVFNYTFKIFEDTDLNVYQTQVGQEPNDDNDLITGYSVSDVGDEDGGTVTLDTGASAGDLITIVSDIPESRTTDYQNNGDFRPDTVNDDFDRVVSLVKQAHDKVNRTLTFPESQQDAGSLLLPVPEASLYLRWRTDNLGLENVNLTAVGTSFATPDPIRSILTGDTTFAYNGAAKLTLILDPNGSDRNVNPSGAFPDGFEVEVVNNGPTGSGTYNTLTFDSTGLGGVIGPGDRQPYIYLLTEDEWI